MKYICSYCGGEYDTAPERARCEIKCDEKHRQEAERERRRKLDEERGSRVKEIEAAREHLAKLTADFEKDYKTDILSWDSWVKQEFPWIFF